MPTQTKFYPQYQSELDTNNIDSTFILRTIRGCKDKSELQAAREETEKLIDRNNKLYDRVSKEPASLTIRAIIRRIGYINQTLWRELRTKEDYFRKKSKTLEKLKPRRVGARELARLIAHYLVKEAQILNTEHPPKDEALLRFSNAPATDSVDKSMDLINNEVSDIDFLDGMSD